MPWWLSGASLQLLAAYLPSTLLGAPIYAKYKVQYLLLRCNVALVRAGLENKFSCPPMSKLTCTCEQTHLHLQAYSFALTVIFIYTLE